MSTLWKIERYGGRSIATIIATMNLVKMQPLLAHNWIVSLPRYTLYKLIIFNYYNHVAFNFMPLSLHPFSLHRYKLLL